MGLFNKTKQRKNGAIGDLVGNLTNCYLKWHHLQAFALRRFWKEIESWTTEYLVANLKNEFAPRGVDGVARNS